MSSLLLRSNLYHIPRSIPSLDPLSMPSVQGSGLHLRCVQFSASSTHSRWLRQHCLGFSSRTKVHLLSSKTTLTCRPVFLPSSSRLIQLPPTQSRVTRAATASAIVSSPLPSVTRPRDRRVISVSFTCNPRRYRASITPPQPPPSIQNTVSRAEVSCLSSSPPARDALTASVGMARLRIPVIFSSIHPGRVRVSITPTHRLSSPRARLLSPDTVPPFADALGPPPSTFLSSTCARVSDPVLRSPSAMLRPDKCP